MTEPRKLQVLAESGGVTVADVTGMQSPVVVLDDEAMARLLLLLRDVQEKGSVMSAEYSLSVNKLLAAVETIVEQYRVTRNRFHGGVNPRVEVLGIKHELDQAVRELEKIMGTRK